MNRAFFVVILLVLLIGFGAYYIWRGYQKELPADVRTTIGYIGCSNTSQAVMGYRLAGGVAMWEVTEKTVHDFDGGAVVDWAKNVGKGNKFWRTFDRYLTANPNTEKIWWQMCVRHQDAPSLEDALEVVAAAQQRIPGVTMYVSSLPSYISNVCEITGLEGIERGKALARELAFKSEAVELGPEFAAHERGEIEEDGCHLNEAGMRKLGGQLKQFFNHS